MFFKQTLALLSLCLTATLAYADKGQELALDENKGNCHACHNLPGAEKSGNIGPTLQGMALKYPKVEDLQAYLYDPAVKNAHTIMPPYGRHRILSEDELEEISKFLHKL